MIRRLAPALLASLAIAAPAFAQHYHVHPDTGHLYLLTPPVSDVFAARAAAAERGGYLAVVQDATEQQFLVDAFGSQEQLWLGLSDEFSEGTFVWDTGETLSYANWMPLQPDNGSGFQDWVAMNGDGDGRWDDVEFDAAQSGVRRGIIEIPAVRNPANGHIYLATGPVADVFEARDQARALGGHLVTISDVAERLFLQTAFPPTERYWIGLSDEDQEGTFGWDSGEAFTYAHWLPGQPDNSAGAENWVYMNQGAAGEWNDAQASPIAPFQVDRGVIEIATRPTENIAVAVTKAPDFSSLCSYSTNNKVDAILDLYSSNGSVSLCKNAVIEVLLGVTVIDGPGPDLIIRENFASTNEKYLVAVSRDSVSWISVPGPLSGGFASSAAIDLDGLAVDEVNFVRLTSKTTQTSSAPGPDIHAIVARNYRTPTYDGEARPYAENLVATSGALDPELVLGPPDAATWTVWNGSAFITDADGYATLNAGDSVTVAFTDHVVTDGPGPDLIIHEIDSPEGELYVVEVSQDGAVWLPLPTATSVSPIYGKKAQRTSNVLAFDIAEAGLPWIELVRITAIGNEPEIDAVEAVHFEERARNGSDEDCTLTTTLNGAGSPESVVKLSSATDFLAVDVRTPAGGFVGGVPIILAQINPIGTVLPADPVYPTVHISTSAPGLFVLFNGLPSSVVGPTLLTPSGLSLGFVIPPGLAGQRLRLQAIVIGPQAANGAFAITDAHDILFQ